MDDQVSKALVFVAEIFSLLGAVVISLGELLKSVPENVAFLLHPLAGGKVLYKFIVFFLGNLNELDPIFLRLILHLGIQEGMHLRLMGYLVYLGLHVGLRLWVWLHRRWHLNASNPLRLLL